MKRIIAAAAVGLSLMCLECAANDYTIEAANGDAKRIWSSGCTDFKAGMNAGDFRGWLKPWEAVKTFSGLKSIAVKKLYMDGWEVARRLGGVVNCQEMASYRAADYVSGVNIRKAE